MIMLRGPLMIAGLAVCSFCHAAQEYNLFVGEVTPTDLVQLHQNGEVRRVVDVMYTPRGMTGGPDGLLYVIEDRSWVRRVDPGTGKDLGRFATLSGSSFMLGVAFGDANDLFVTGSQDGTDGIFRFDGKTGASKGLFSSGGFPSAPSGITRALNGDLIVTSFNDNRVLRYDGATGAYKGEAAIGGFLERPTSVIFLPDGSLIVANSDSEIIPRYDGTTGEYLGSFGVGTGDIQALSLGPDGLVYASQFIPGQGIVRFDSATGEFLGHFGTGHFWVHPDQMAWMPVPEPASLAALSFGLGALIRVRRRHS